MSAPEIRIEREINCPRPARWYWCVEWADSGDGEAGWTRTKIGARWAAFVAALS